MLTNKNSISFFAGFLIGGLAGTTIALLLAPQSGQETRDQIRDQGLELKERAEEQAANARQQAENVQERALKMQEQGRALIEEKTNTITEAASKAKARVAEVV